MLFSLSPGSDQLFTPWVIQFALTMVQDFVIIKTVQVYVVHVLALQVLRPQLKQIYNIISDIALHRLTRMDPFNGDHIRLVQHFSAACRASRMKHLLHLPVSRILRQLDDYDIALCREGRGRLIGLIGKGIFR